MRDEERITLSQLFGMDHNIDMSTVYKEGDSIKVVLGPFVGQGEQNIENQQEQA